KRHGSFGENVSFRHLGPRVEQILTMAEDQASDIRAAAEASVSGIRQRAEDQLAAAETERATAIRDFETALATRRAEEEKASAERRTAAAAEVTAAAEYVAKVRVEIEEQLTTARQDAARTADESKAAAQALLDNANAQ